jgi:hypothetical protein
MLMAAPPASASRANGPDPAVAEWSNWPYQATCGVAPFDPVSVFSSETGAERGSRPAEQALARFVRSEPLPLMGKHDWRLLGESTTSAEFVRGRLSRQLNWLLFEQIGGEWKFQSYSSDCTPSSIVDDHPAVAWSLAREQKRLTARTRSVKVNLGPGPCSGGRSQNAHAHPVFRQLGRRLLMSIWLDPLPPGNYTCVGLIEPPLVVRLPSRLGNRVLYDGGRFPASRAGQTRSEEL